MKNIKIKKEKEKQVEAIYHHREYNIKERNNDYILRLEINDKNINIIITLNNNIEYNYKTQMSLSTFVNKLELNLVKYSNIELIIKLFDEISEGNKLSININDSDESCILLIKLVNPLEKIINYEIKLFKNFMKVDDKLNMLFSQFKLFRNMNMDNDKILLMNNKINELNIKLEQKDNIINEMNKKIINQEERLKNLERKNINVFNGNKKLNESVNKPENEVKILDKKISYLENNLNNIKNNLIQINEIINNIKNLKEEINILNNKIEEKDNYNNGRKIDDKIIEEINKIENNINMKFEEQKNINDKMNDIILFENKRYEYKINYEFKKEPRNLRFKENIIKTNTYGGWNDKFEIFISFKDNKEYLVSPNTNNYKLDIYNLINNKIIYTLTGHNNIIWTTRYFMNNKNYNEYLISADKDKIVIIWDITNNYNIKYTINTKYGNDIYSCLLIFPHNSDDNYIITSTFNDSGKDEDSATKLYSLNNGNFIKYINNTNNNSIYYLLSWYNKRNNKYYIIQFSYKKIIINNLLEEELYSEFSNVSEHDHKSGFIYYIDNNDYLCSSSSNGYINIWDLYNKNIYKVINTNGCYLANIIKWNKKYIIVADYNNKSFKIIDIDNDSIYDVNTDHNDKLACIKKINHPKYGESLFTAARDKIIKLWTIE